MLFFSILHADDDRSLILITEFLQRKSKFSFHFFLLNNMQFHEVSRNASQYSRSFIMNRKFLSSIHKIFLNFFLHHFKIATGKKICLVTKIFLLNCYFKNFLCKCNNKSLCNRFKLAL